MGSNTFSSLKPMFKEKYGKPAKGVPLRINPSAKIYKPQSEYKTGLFPKLKGMIKIHY